MDRGGIPGTSFKLSRVAMASWTIAALREV